MKEKDPLGQTEQLFDFLQGKLPEGYRVRRSQMPKLTPDQAWTVIWYLGNLYWQVPDFIERCDVCGDLYNTHSEGHYLDFGKAPYSFCEGCMSSDAHARKSKSRLNPDRLTH